MLACNEGKGARVWVPICTHAECKQCTAAWQHGPSCCMGLHGACRIYHARVAAPTRGGAGRWELHPQQAVRTLDSCLSLAAAAKSSRSTTACSALQPSRHPAGRTAQVCAGVWLAPLAGWRSEWLHVRTVRMLYACAQRSHCPLRPALAPACACEVRIECGAKWCAPCSCTSPRASSPRRFTQLVPHLLDVTMAAGGGACGCASP